MEHIGTCISNVMVMVMVLFWFRFWLSIYTPLCAMVRSIHSSMIVSQLTGTPSPYSVLRTLVRVLYIDTYVPYVLSATL